MTEASDVRPAAGHSPWSVLSGYPDPLPLTAGYDRHQASAVGVRDQLRQWSRNCGPADGSWTTLIRTLLAAGRADVPLVRLFEGHVDALRILDQAGRAPIADALYGVWASRSQRTGVAAQPSDDQLVLDGTIRFASGAGVVDRALVPVWLDAETHLLVDLDVSDLPVDSTQWATAAMEVSRSHTVAVADVRVAADQVIGDPGFYLGRPDFFPGGIGVAACWAGGAARIADLACLRLHDPVPEPMAVRLGSIRTQLTAAAAALHTAGAVLDDVTADDGKNALDRQGVSTEVRAVVAAAVAEVISQVQRVAGPAGLAFDRDLTRASHDLQVYVLQQNADGDALYLGRACLS